MKQICAIYLYPYINLISFNTTKILKTLANKYAKNTYYFQLFVKFINQLLNYYQKTIFFNLTYTLQNLQILSTYKMRV